MSGYWGWESSDGLSYAEISASDKDLPYPGMVNFEGEFSSMMAYDARALANLLLLAADEADK